MRIIAACDSAREAQIGGAGVNTVARARLICSAAEATICSLGAARRTRVSHLIKSEVVAQGLLTKQAVPAVV